MTSFTFSSRTRRGATLVWVFLAASAVLVVAGLIVDFRIVRWRMNSPYQVGMPAVDDRTIVTQLLNVLDFDAYLYDHAGAIAYARQADLLILGNSRALYGFRPEAYQPYLDRHGLRGYTLAFLGGGETFALELIRRHDLRPRFVIVNSDGFFRDAWSAPGVAAIARGQWDSRKHYAESVAAWEAQLLVHRVVPSWRQYLYERDHHVIYRSIDTGGIRFPYALPNAHLLTERRPDSFTAAEVTMSDAAYASELAHLRDFTREMAARGTTVILTVVPYPELQHVHLTQRLSAATGIPYVQVWPENLYGYNGTHLDTNSAQRFTDALFAALNSRGLLGSATGVAP